jgi:hypothetical protein
MKQPINNRSTISSVNPSPNLVALSQSNPEHNYYNNIDLGAAGAYSNAFVEDAINFYYSNGQTKFAVQTGTDKKGNPLYTTTDLGGLEKTVNSIKDENLRMAALGNMPGTLNYNNGNTNLNISPASRRSLGKESYYDKQDIGSFGALMGRMNPLQVDPNSLKMQPVNTVSLKGPSKSNPVPEGRGTQSCGPDGCIWQNAYGGPIDPPTLTPSDFNFTTDRTRGNARYFTDPRTGEPFPLVNLPEATVSTERVPYADISNNSRLAGVYQAKPWFEAGNYAIGQRVLNERQADLNRAAGIYEFTGIPGMVRTTDRIQNDPASLFSLEGGLDALSFLPTTVIGSKGLKTASTIGKESAINAGKFLTTQTPLKDAYKLNPYAFKPNPEAYYRGIGKEGMEDALQSGVFRARATRPPGVPDESGVRLRGKGFGNYVYFSPEFEVADRYGKGFIGEVPKNSANWQKHSSPEHASGWSQFSQTPIPIDQGRILQKDWLKGYKEIPKPTSSVDDVGKRFYHAGLEPNATLDDIDITRLAQRQQKKGREYAGFYMSPDLNEGSWALKYSKENPTKGLHEITLNKDAKGFVRESSMERITKQEIEKLQKQGYDYIEGKNMFGQPEYVLLNKNKASMKNINQYMFGGLAAGLASALGANETITNVAGLAGSGLGMLVNPLSGLQGAKYATGLLGEGLGNSKNSFAMGGDITKFTGPSHEQGGIAIGQNVEVEGGELMTPSKIVMSDRLGPNGKKGPTYAELAEKLRKRKEKRPGDKLSAEAVDREIAALEQLQESDPNILAAREKSNKQMMALGGPLEEDPINPQAFASLFGNNPSNALNYLNPEQTQQALSHLTSIFPQLEKNKDQYATRLEDYQANMGSTPFTGLVGMGAQSRADDASGAANKANMAANALNAVGGFNNATRPFQTPFNNNNMELVQPIAPYEIGTMLDSQGNSNYRHPGFINRDPAILSNRTNLDKPLPGEFDEFVPRPNVKIKDFKGSPGTTIPYGEDTSSVTTDWYNNIDTFNKNNPENNAQVNTLDSVKPNPWGYAAQAIGPLAQGLYAALTPAENTQFERINPAMMNLDTARQGMRRNASLSQANARRMNAGARTVGANIAANTASNVGISRGLQDGFLNSYLQENMYNTNATNQARQANASIAMQERDANDRNEAQRRNMIFNSIGNLGTGLAAGLSENTALQAQELMNQRYLNMANSMFSNYIMSPDGTVQFRS